MNNIFFNFFQRTDQIFGDNVQSKFVIVELLEVDNEIRLDFTHKFSLK